ncbi:hypothetical protein EZS27_018130 [termite gut metagenome]|uniref:Uncharacterized protein n=1 Tax=termite gut metagenome TaxID=433724 RepID=A0A5J4RIM7_9ZZZZ
MHRFYLTNNLGGGGTNVSRFVDYKQLFDLPNIGLLLNYYYLSGNFDIKMKFDTSLINTIHNYNDIADFLNVAKTYFTNCRSVSSFFKQNVEPTTINGYMLDNGCGNILRDLLQNDTYSSKLINKLIEPFHDFAELLKFDFAIALDYAMKYTYKDNESRDLKSKKLWQKLAGDEEINLSLITTTLELFKSKKYSHHIYAPIHGFDYSSFEDYSQKILETEQKIGSSFNGFALGGIADTRKLPNSVWSISSTISGEIKTGYIVSKLCQSVRSKTDRPLHILGAGSIYVLPFIINAGATSSDCHSAWRRASDGGFDKAKILIPLLNDKLEFINSKHALKYVRIRDIDDSYNFDFGYSIADLKKLYQSDNKENLYFAEILAFYEAIKQYDLIIRFTNTYSDFLQRLCKTTDNEFNTNYQILSDSLNQ